MSIYFLCNFRVSCRFHHWRTSRSKERLQEYLAVEDLRMFWIMQHYIYLIFMKPHSLLKKLLPLMTPVLRALPPSWLLRGLQCNTNSRGLHPWSCGWLLQLYLASQHFSCSEIVWGWYKWGLEFFNTHPVIVSVFHHVHQPSVAEYFCIPANFSLCITSTHDSCTMAYTWLGDEANVETIQYLANISTMFQRFSMECWSVNFRKNCRL